MSERSVASIIIEQLEKAGVQHCYGVVGDTLNYITDEMSRSNIKWLHVRHEEVAGFAAGAEALMTDRLTACAGSCGPGGLHFINGLFESHRNRAPVILLASQISSELLGNDFPQEVDFLSVYQSCSVFCEQILTADQAPAVIRRACQAALNQRGVAVVVVPVDISKAKTHAVTQTIWQPQPQLIPNPHELQTIAALLNKGKRVAIYAGAGCEGAHDDLVALADQIKAPIVNTSRGKDFIEYDNPYSVGMTGIFGCEAGFEAIKQCDVLLLLGADFAWSQFYPDNATIIQIDHQATHLGRRHPIAFGAVGRVSDTLSALLPLVDTKSNDQFFQQIAKVRDKSVNRRHKEEQRATGHPIHPQYLVSLLNQHAAKDAFFTADGGSAMVWLLRHIDSLGTRRTLASLLHGTMANAMPQAIGLQVAFPERQVIALCGDGGLSMLLGDLFTLVQEALPVKLVVINNGSLNFVELEQKVEGLLDHYTKLKNDNFAKVAGAIGLYSQKVVEAETLEDAIARFLAHPGPALLDVHTHPNELVMPPEISLTQVADTALYATKALFHGRLADVASFVGSEISQKLGK
ncbi:thiamine pyrophosphate-dependent enzyme [Rosenbergiella epipactidis]|uniref:thiamine pyrophosphate-dependent enzyme n=2 Tax=Rosenbergiella TaxID=1356488 RepID=UPI000789C96E|nr:thiamine pyrophosphate-dependent enzyme [Rosenbergiella epipactidis]KYP95197.1 pyruvate dehydrogenase [bacteria symbiont BFo2 of Frankliniella occidentalis]